ncbi:C2 domain-containing protein, partial [Saccharata proteae CBS 121410]
KQDQPPGGYDSTPIPHAPPGYTVKITFHRATNLPMADLNTLSSDPFIMAQIYTGLRTRHKEDPALVMRTPTIRRCTDPEWNSEWIVANIPASGFKMKVRIYDEDPADHDDRLGNAHVEIGRISESWEGIKEQPFDLKKRMGSKRAYALRAVAVCFSQAKHMSGTCYISVEVLGKTPGDEGGRAYTIGPNWWTRHYSPLLGRIANRKDSKDDADDQGLTGEERKRVERYNFQANQFQLRGPVPAELYHRYVEFKPFVKSMFTAKGIRGYLLSKALHHQHNRVYNFDKSTLYGKFPQGPSQEMTLKFLDLVHYDQGGRIFTYVLTLDALFRFTETGKEFGIDMLSKHTMHSDVSIYIAFSGEFFIRRLAHSERPPPSPSADSEDQDNATHPPNKLPDGPPDADPPTDPARYELVIDNDSGTYRPNGALLPLLKRFLSDQFPGLKIVTLDSQKDAEIMNKMKQEQRDRKAREGDTGIYRQASNGSSSISSSDEEGLEEVE